MAGSIGVKHKKRGRPATGHDPLVGLRLSPEMTARVDAWAERQNLTRSEAIRQMIEQALGVHDMANRRKQR
jgi:predicted DNA-binding protein